MANSLADDTRELNDSDTSEQAGAEDNGCLCDSSGLYNAWKDGSSKGICRISTGIGPLDEALCGGILEKGLTVLGAAPAMGKTTLALQIAANVAKGGRNTIIFSLEMTRGQLFERLATGVEKELRDETKARKFLEEASGRLFITDSRHFIKDIVEEFEEFLRAHNQTDNALVPLVIIDYLQVIGIDDQYADLRERTNRLLEGLQQIWRDSALLLISSFNRASYNVPISETSFKETGEIEFRADVLMGLQYAQAYKWKYNDAQKKREMREKPRKLRIDVVKNRYGETKTSDISFHAEEFRFEAPAESPQAVQSETASDLLLSDAEDDGRPFYSCILYGVTNYLRSDPESATRKKKERTKKGSNHEITLEYDISGSPGNVTYTLTWGKGGALGPYDMLIADAIYTLFERKQASFRPIDIKLAITGGGRMDTREGGKWELDMRESIARLRDCRISIAETRGGNLETLYGPGEFLHVADGENRGFSFIANCPPLPLYAYAERDGRFATYDERLLRVDRYYTQKTYLTVHHLLRRQARLDNKNNEKNNRLISLESNSVLIQENPCLRNIPKKKVWETVKSLLDGWGSEVELHLGEKPK